MTDTSVPLTEFTRWKDTIPSDEECESPQERGTKICIPSLSRACCRDCYSRKKVIKA